jgi:hypothetical protein
MRSIVCVACVLQLSSLGAAAQWLRYPSAGVPRTRDGKPDLAARAPRTANGTPDLSGVWENDGYDPNVPEGSGGGPPKTRKAAFGKDNPDARCLPLGALQMMAHPLPKKIIQAPGLLAILHERNMEFRQIFTDGRPLPVDPNPSWSGYSTGKWEQDTLVVQTSGFRDGLWADFNGSPLTDAATITERFRRPTYGRLEVEVTVDDRKAYTRPWTIHLNQHIVVDTDLLEYACLENEKDVAHIAGR